MPLLRWIANWMRPMAFVVPSVLDRGDRDLMDVGPGGVVGSAALDALRLEQLQYFVTGGWVASQLGHEASGCLGLDPLLGQKVEDRRDHISIGTSAHGLLTEADADSVDVAVSAKRDLHALATVDRPLDGSAGVLDCPRTSHGPFDQATQHGCICHISSLIAQCGFWDLPRKKSPFGDCLFGRDEAIS